MSKVFPGSEWRIPAEQRRRNRQLKNDWRQGERERLWAESHKKSVLRCKQAVSSVLYDFSPKGIPLASSLVRSGIVGKDSLQWLIMGLRVDSYYLDCLQTIRKFSDIFAGTLPFDEEIATKILQMMIDLDVEIDHTSFENPNHLIDDLLSALITMKASFSPNQTSDLWREFDLSIGQYFPNMPSVRLKQGMEDWKKSVWNIPRMSEMESRLRRMAGDYLGEEAIRNAIGPEAEAEFRQTSARAEEFARLMAMKVVDILESQAKRWEDAEAETVAG